MPEFLQEALDWQAAREPSRLETEWALHCRAADPCLRSLACLWLCASGVSVYQANRPLLLLDSVELAAALWAVIITSRPSKTTQLLLHRRPKQLSAPDASFPDSWEVPTKLTLAADVGRPEAASHQRPGFGPRKVLALVFPDCLPHESSCSRVRVALGCLMWQLDIASTQREPAGVMRRPCNHTTCKLKLKHCVWLTETGASGSAGGSPMFQLATRYETSLLHYVCASRPPARMALQQRGRKLPLSP